ncbi:MAG TPA: hypothetical protein VLA34_02935 [Candidatus Krumholzibacterium sp.]|nr:hypothetical protein [Candidatus Krumholzibacterium sp.]
MKTLKSALILCALLAVATSAIAQPEPCTVAPNPGSYTTVGGGMLPGRASEAFCGVPYGGQPGNQQNAASWDGATLGGQWKVYGMTIDAAGAVELVNTVNPVTGNGMIVYQTAYDGGTFWLSGTHTWGDSVNDMTGAVNDYQVTATVSVVAGLVTSIASNVYFTGVFDDCPDCYFEFVIANALRVWAGEAGSLPADYPAFYCAEATAGEAFDICCIDLSIDCKVGNRESSWGAIKQLHR